MKAVLNMMMEYNRWANERLFADCERVTEEIYHRNLKTEYGSIHRTLDHILLVDLLWLDRFAGAGDKYPSFDQTITDTFKELRARRQTTDEDLSRFCQESTEVGLTRMVQFKTVLDPATIEQPVGGAIILLFHHQSHYRAQAQALLSMQGYEPQMLNLMYFQRQTGLGLMG